ncbi:hypothetical protein SOVF_182720 [Spinacia oleracea]|nr:hypothetical protein SOVF_182720 [Spinacia oleracea]
MNALETKNKDMGTELKDLFTNSVAQVIHSVYVDAMRIQFALRFDEVAFYLYAVKLTFRTTRRLLLSMFNTD